MARARADYEIRAHDQTGRAFASVRRSLRETTGAFFSFRGAIVGALGAAGLGSAVRSMVNDADQIGKLSQRLGISTNALTELRHAADLSGVTFNTLTMGLQRMTRRVAEAAQGTGEAKGALAELNLDAARLASLSPDRQFELIADALAGVGNQSDRVRLAMKLFDSEGVQLLQTMGDGANGIREMRAEADALGLSLGRDQTDAAAAANDALTRLSAAGRGLMTQAIVPLAGALEKAADIARAVFLPVWDTISTAFRGVGQLIGGVAASIAALISGEFTQAWEIAKSTVTDFGESAVQQLGNVERVATSFYEAVTGGAESAAKATTALASVQAAAPGAAPPAGGRAPGGLAAAMAMASAGLAERQGLGGQAGAFRDLGLARIARDGGNLGASRPQKIESDQLQEAIEYLRTIAERVGSGSIAVVG